MSSEMLKQNARLLISPVLQVAGWTKFVYGMHECIPLSMFCRRHNLVRTSVAQRLPSDLEEKILTFIRRVRELRIKN